MEDFKNDTRFSHIASDPRFRSMPKSKKKVKIDKRFQSLFSNKDFGHKTHIDKRGRPLLNGSKKEKHAMERFYDLSDSDLEEADSDIDLDITNEVKDESQEVMKKEVLKKSTSDKPQPPKAKKRKTAEEYSMAPKQKKAKHKMQSVFDTGENLKSDLPAEHRTTQETSKLKGHQPSKASVRSLKKQMLDADEEEEYESEEEHNDSEESESGEEEEDCDGSGDEVEVDEDILEYTKDHEIEETEVDHRWNELHADAPEVSESTSRLAVCNMDWDFVKAQDLYMLFKSFLPEGGAVRSVAIYPSEFGKERMAEEMLLGPKELREQGKDEDEGEKKKGKNKKQKRSGGDQQKAKRQEKEKDSEHTEKLREYQLNRLRYYYAVVECDSVRSADSIYTECDGREYQLSSVRLDLRFIPEDMTFDDEPKERFSEQDQGVNDYQPNTFNSSALSQAKVEVTWDETDFDRLSRKVSGLQQKELQTIVEENKYADIIAPPESDSEAEEGDGRPEWLRSLLAEGGDEEQEVTEEDRIRLYKKVLMEKLAADEEDERREEGELDKELEWQPGLKTTAEKKLKKKEKGKDQNAIVGDYLEKKKEKRKKKKEERAKKRNEEKAGQGEDEEEGTAAFSDDDLPAGFDVDDMKEMLAGEDDLQSRLAAGKKKGKKKGKKGKGDDDGRDEEDEQARAELELILMDADSQKKPAKPEPVKDSSGKKSKKKKKKELAKLKKSGEGKEDFELDLEDDRFSALYSSHHFHIDPSAPQFKKTKNMLKLMDEQIKRKSKKGEKDVGGRARLSLTDNDLDKTSSSKSTSQSLIESLKRKMKK